MEKGVLPELYMQYVFAIGSASLFMPVLISWILPGQVSADTQGNLTFVGQIHILAFSVFEATVGAFWPSIMKMRSIYVPEELRATIINVFRMPLNLFVCVVLYNVNLFSVATYLGMCGGFLAIAAYCQRSLYRLVKGAPAGADQAKLIP